MNSKRAARDKRATLPRASDFTRVFLKDWERLSRSGRFDMKQLKEVMLMLIANDAPLPQQWLDHPLTGQWARHRECHIGGDFLLIYRLDSGSSQESVVFVRVGTHADLFE